MPRAPQRPLAVRNRKVEELIPYARNARTHSDAQVAQIAASIAEFGFTNPVLTDGDAIIIAGHGRVLAARKLGMDTVPTIELPHLSDAQRRAYVIADNKIALNGGWDMDMLVMELGDIASGEDAMDATITGFGAEEIERMLGGGGEMTTPQDEWVGMPEFDQPDKTAFRSIVVHFKDQEAVDAFTRLLGQSVTDKTKFLWYPAVQRETYTDKRYAAGGGGEP